MGTAVGIIILIVVLLVAVFAVYATKSAPAPPNWGPSAPSTDLASALSNAQNAANALVSALTEMSSEITGAYSTGMDLSMANGQIPSAPSLDQSGIAKGAGEYTKALQSDGGTQQVVNAYQAGLQGLTADSNIGAILHAADATALSGSIITLQSGVQDTASAINNMVSTVGTNLSLAPKMPDGTPIPFPFNHEVLSGATSAAQQMLTAFGNLVTAGKVAASAAATLTQYAQGTGPISVGAGHADHFRGRPHSPCRASAPSRSCGPPFAVCMSEKCRIGNGCSSLGATLPPPYENPILNPWGGLVIWP